MYVLEPSANATEETFTNGDDDDDGPEEVEKVFENKAADYYACEKQIDLFVLQQQLFIKGQFQGDISPMNGRYLNNIYTFRNISFPILQTTNHVQSYTLAHHCHQT